MFFPASKEQNKQIIFCTLFLCAGVLFSFFTCGTVLRTSVIDLTAEAHSVNTFMLLQEEFLFSPVMRCPGSQVLSLLLRQRSSRFAVEKRKRGGTGSDPFLQETPHICFRFSDRLCSASENTPFLLAVGLFQPCSNTPVRAGPVFLI